MPAGRAPAQATFRAASQTVATAPRYGSSAHARGFESALRASPRPESLMRKTAASLPGPTTVLPCTSESYCRKTIRFEATFGLEMIARRASAGGGELAAIALPTDSTADGGACIGRS